MNIYLIVNGNNDLEVPFSKGIEKLLNNHKNLLNDDIDIHLIYTLGVGKNNDFFKMLGCTLEKNDGYFKISKNTIKKEKFEFTEDIALNIEKVLEKIYDENQINMLILSGHGGPFQSFLDMRDISKSYSTLYFCNIIKKYKFEIVFLDMCAMNYIEVIYELLINENIKNVITYKGIASFECLDYVKVINNIAYMKKIEDMDDLNLILFNQEDKKELEDIKGLFNKISRNCLLEENIGYKEDIKKLLKSINSKNLNFIKSALVDEIEKKIYMNYVFLEKNFWKYIICGSMKKEDIDIKYIDLTKASLEHIFMMHNPKCKKIDIEKFY